MIRSAEEPNTFLWVLRGLASAFLLGYLLNVFFTTILYEIFPAGSLIEDLPAIGLLILVLNYTKSFMVMQLIQMDLCF